MLFDMARDDEAVKTTPNPDIDDPAVRQNGEQGSLVFSPDRLNGAGRVPRGFGTGARNLNGGQETRKVSRPLFWSTSTRHRGSGTCHSVDRLFSLGVSSGWISTWRTSDQVSGNSAVGISRTSDPTEGFVSRAVP